MALINCKECGKEISDTINKCPHCGYKFKNNDFILRYSNIFINLIIFIIGISILLGRSRIISSQNEMISLSTYSLSIKQYKDVINHTNIVCIITVLFLIYAIISTYKIFKNQHIKSKIIDFMIKKLDNKKELSEKVKNNDNKLSFIITIATMLVGFCSILLEDGFISQFKNSFEVFEMMKTNEYLNNIYLEMYIRDGFLNPLLYIFIICYICMFVIWKIRFQKLKK